MLYLYTMLRSNTWEEFEREGLVCPQLRRLNAFSTYATDNVDHNPSSAT